MKTLDADFTIGFLGAGQLARMSALAAFRLGFKVVSFSNRSETEPLENVCAHHYKGSFENEEDMVQFAKKCDLITLENEFIDGNIFREVTRKSGTPLYPTTDTFALIENKFSEKKTFEKAGIDVAPYRMIANRQDLESFGDEHGWPFVLKSSKGGYDGYGNESVPNLEDAVSAFQKLGGEQGHDIIAEAQIDFEKELAVQVARNETGTAVYPCCETVQQGHICTAVLSPARVDESIRKRAQELAVAASKAIDVRGIFAFEFFLKPDGSLILNESAPRPHNSGHYTIDGCETSQFENHVRAVAGLPLGSTALVSPAVAMINLLGTHERPATVESALPLLETDKGHLHIYGKEQSRPGRKMGHFTLLGDHIENTYTRAQELTDEITI